MANYDALLANDTRGSKNGLKSKDDDIQLSKEEQVKELDRLTGKMFRLSNFIDPEFLDQCLAQPVQSLPTKSSQQKKPIFEFLEIMQNYRFDNWLFSEMADKFG